MFFDSELFFWLVLANPEIKGSLDGWIAVEKADHISIPICYVVIDEQHDKVKVVQLFDDVFLMSLLIFKRHYVCN